MFVCEQSCEDDETFQLLQLSKDDQAEERGDEGDEELIIAEYQSDDESKPRSRLRQISAGFIKMVVTNGSELKTAVDFSVQVLCR